MLTSVQADGGVIKLLVFLLEWGLGGLGSVNRGRCQMDRPKHRTLLPNTTPPPGPYRDHQPWSLTADARIPYSSRILAGHRSASVLAQIWLGSGPDLAWI